MRTRILTLIVALLAVPAFAQVQPAPVAPWPGITPPIFGGPSSGVSGSGVVTAPQLLAPDGSATAPSYSFVSQTNKGIHGAVVGGVTVAVGAANIGVFAGTGLNLGTLALGFAGGDPATTSPDVTLSRLAADVMAPAAGDAYGLAAKAWIRTAPTVSSAGSSPSVPASNGTAAFTVNVGTGGAATTIVMTMPTATTGWACDAQNLTANAANRANQHVVQQSSTTTSVTVQNQTISTGAALAFTASDIVRFLCTAY